MKILFLEDDLRVASGVVRLVKNMGHEMIHARNISEATAAVKAGGIEAVLTDLGLPNDESGIDFVHWVATEYPAMPRVLTSGGSKPSNYVVSPPYQLFMYKPFGRQDLQQMFDELTKALARNKEMQPPA